MVDRLSVVSLKIVCTLLFVCCCPLASSAAYPMIYGVTEGSIYKEYVRIYWFEDVAQATLAVDGGMPTSYTKGSQINGNGSYRIELSVEEDGQTFTNAVEFQINTGLSAALLKTNDDPAATGLVVEFDPGTYTRTPIIVVWTEDMDGDFLQNLYISSAAATNYMRHTNSMVNRPQAVPYWAHKTCDPTGSGSNKFYVADPVTPVPKGLDGVSGATQMLGFQLDSHVNPPMDGTRIKVMLEINQSYDNGWYFASENEVDEETDGPDGTILPNTTKFRDDGYFSGSEEPSLVYAVEVLLDQPGTYTTTAPLGYGHYGGRTGTLYTDFYADNGGTQRHKFDKAIDMVESLSVTVLDFSKRPGDINGDGVVDLKDIITGLKICIGDSQSADSNSDVGSDNKVGLEEVIYVLEQNMH